MEKIASVDSYVPHGMSSCVSKNAAQVVGRLAPPCILCSASSPPPFAHCTIMLCSLLEVTFEKHVHDKRGWLAAGCGAVADAIHPSRGGNECAGPAS